ncbi:hypothetical protein NADE_006739 [Nannochloris sp. 'desiccata']|nr:hypothetical protein KSW81_005319 [Chlorella desiccata (nom. nud.)]KAH7621476.1 hypothetical protein NADE_006739 [Chlorella desiccata (nom. nud.)]
MGDPLCSNSTSSTPRLYEDVTLLLADPEKQFPEEFDPKRPFKVKVMKKTSRETFCSRLANVNGEAVVALEDFDPTGQKDEPPELVELCDEATYIVVPREDKATEKRFESIEVWQKNQTSGDERMLVKRAMKELEKNHTNVRPWCKKKLTGPDGWFREVDAAAIADGCAIIVEHKNIMDSQGASQLTELADEIDAYKDSGVGTVADFAGLRIMCAIAGPVETSNPNDLKKMNARLQRYNCYKWFEEKGYGDDPCSPFQASGASCDADVSTKSPGNGPTAPAAVPRRVGRLLAPMRGSTMLVRPRLANRVSGFRSSF